MAYKFNYLNEIEGVLKVTGNRKHCKVVKSQKRCQTDTVTIDHQANS